jgi:hypothetical protein
VVLFPKIYYPSLITPVSYEKNIRWISYAGYSTIIPDQYSQNSQSHQKQGESKKLLKLREASRDMRQDIILAGGVAQVEEHLPSKHETLIPPPANNNNNNNNINNMVVWSKERILGKN